MARKGHINITKEMLCPWEDLLITTVDPSQLLPFLQEERIFDGSQEADELKENLRQNSLLKRELWEKLLKYLYQQQHEGVQTTRSFLNALKRAGYDFQVDWIYNRSESASDPNNRNHKLDEYRVFKNLLDLFTSDFCRILDPQDLLPYFVEKELLLDCHIELVMKYSTRNQKVLGILYYMTLSGKEDWPKRFCEVLLEAGQEHEPYKELALRIEPEFANLSTDESLVKLFKANTLNDDNEDALNYCQEGEKKLSTQCHEDPEVTNRASSCIKDYATKKYDISEADIISSNNETAVKSLNIEPLNDGANNLSWPHVNDISSAASVFSAEDNTSYPEASGSWDDVEGAGRQGLMEIDGGQTSQREELKLRAYQRELAKAPLEGLNTIIIARTGTGKTHVAAHVAKVHLETAANKNKCVVFLVPHLHLVNQQEIIFRQYLSSRKIVKLQGANTVESRVPLECILEQNDVVIMTPQCLVNELNKKGPELLERITLLLIDECHETKKCHPCKEVMSFYLDAKLDEVTSNMRHVPLPQVVGLTASVSAKNAKSSEENLLKLAADLDAQTFQMVREEKEDFNQHVNDPLERQLLVEGRQNDQFKAMIESIMMRIESIIKNIPESTYTCSAPDLRKHILAPLAERNMQQYMNWLSDLHTKAQNILDEKLQRMLVTAKECLEVLHRGLEINDDCESLNALEFIKKKWEQPQFNSENQSPAESEIYQIFLDKLDHLSHICQLESQMNPKLTKLFEILEEEYLSPGNECRIIIFVRTRDMTKSLVKWVERQSSIALLQPLAIVGRIDMTSPEQIQTLNKFQSGDCQLLIATSVAEQGLDIPQCNLVICYEYVTDATGRVQTRGRARAKNARYIVVTENKIAHDDANILNEERMNIALQSICEMQPEVFSNKVKKIQKLDWEERKEKARIKEATKKRKEEEAREFFELQCSKCGIMKANPINQEDLRIAENAHHFVINRDFANFYVSKPLKNEKWVDGIEKFGKIYCKECRIHWGSMFRYKHCDLPVLNAHGFKIVFKDKAGTKNKTPKRWRDIPIKVKKLQDQELVKFQEDEINHDVTKNDNDEV